MQWLKERLPLGYNGELNHDVYTAVNESFMAQAINAGGGNSSIFSRERFCHWTLGFMNNTNGKKLFEPSYQQKLMVLKDVGIWKEIALEVMPPEFDVVDRVDAYHLWEFQYPYSFIFDIRPIYDEPDVFEKEVNGIEYHVTTSGLVRYLYFKPKNKDEQIGWRKKQNLKNLVIGVFGTAVEIITEEMSYKDYACMICFPMNRYLDFGLD